MKYSQIFQDEEEKTNKKEEERGGGTSEEKKKEKGEHLVTLLCFDLESTVKQFCYCWYRRV